MYRLKALRKQPRQPFCRVVRRGGWEGFGESSRLLCSMRENFYAKYSGRKNLCHGLSGRLVR